MKAHRRQEHAREPALREVSAGVQHWGAAHPLAPAAPAHQRQLREQELFEGKPPAARVEVRFRIWEVGGGERGASIGEAFGGAQRSAQGLRDIAECGCVLAHKREDLCRGEPFGGRVVRNGV